VVLISTSLPKNGQGFINGYRRHLMPSRIHRHYFIPLVIGGLCIFSINTAPFGKKGTVLTHTWTRKGSLLIYYSWFFLFHLPGALWYMQRMPWFLSHHGANFFSCRLWICWCLLAVFLIFGGTQLGTLSSLPNRSLHH